MATVKSKKPVSKLKAGKKKKVNKWLIVGGIAAVAIIGAVVVRFSSAATWQSVYRNANPSGLYQLSLGSQGGTWNRPVGLVKGGVYRYCVRGYSLDISTTVQISLDTASSSSSRKGAALSTKTYGRTSQLHCSKEFYATKSYIATGHIVVTSEYGSRTRGMIVTAQSIDRLR